MKDQGKAGVWAHGVSLEVGIIFPMDATVAPRCKGALP